MADGAQEVPVERTGHGWSFEWRGLLPVVVIVGAALLGWRALGGTDPASGEAGQVADIAVTTTERVAITTTSSVVASSTTAPTTVPVTTTTAPLAPTVNIVGEMKPCRFGDHCLVASFTIAGFDETSGRFTCIYPNSTREFSFRDDGKEEACLTADEGDTIIIEVDGVRSAAISEDDLDG